MSRIVKPTSHHPTIPPSQKVTAILEAARYRFARFGFSKVTMDEIAYDVGIVKGALYYYFPTKEKIFEAVIREEQETFIAEIEKLMTSRCATGEKFSGYVQKRQHFVKRLMSLGQLDYEAWRKLKPHFQDLFQQFDRRECTLVRRILEEGAASEQFTFSDSAQHARLFLRAIKGLRLLDAVYGGQRSRESTDLDQEIRLFTSIFLSGIQQSKRRYKKT